MNTDQIDLSKIKSLWDKDELPVTKEVVYDGRQDIFYLASICWPAKYHKYAAVTNFLARELFEYEGEEHEGILILVGRYGGNINIFGQYEWQPMSVLVEDRNIIK